MTRRRTSIQTRVAVWYAAFIILFMVFATIFVYNVTDGIVLDSARKDLSDAVDQAVDNITLVNGRFNISPSIDYDANGAVIALFDGRKTNISGLLPEDFPDGTAFVDDEIRTTETDERRYFLYDRLIESETDGDIWVRGIMSAELSEISPDLLSMTNNLLLLLPIFFVIAIIGGLFITHRAFIPLRRITDTAVKITESGDLAQRIGLGDSDSHDEVIRAAGVFDDMLDRLETAFDDEKRFTNDASHELRTPTAVIMAQAEYALGDPDDKEEVISSLQTILKESKKMDSLVSQLLILARADHGTLRLTMERTDISLLAEESCEMQRRFAREKNIMIATDCDEGVYMDVDPVFFSKIYDNLISNAIKYGKSNGHIYVSVNQNLDGTRSGKGIQITIRDDGIGISEEALPHIFERFYRERRTYAKDSIGLGLPIVHWIVEKHGGSISCISRKDEGTKFIVSF